MRGCLTAHRTVKVLASDMRLKSGVLSKHVLKRQPSCDSYLADCSLCLFCCSMQFCAFDMHGAYYSLIFKTVYTQKKTEGWCCGSFG